MIASENERNNNISFGSVSSIALDAKGWRCGDRRRAEVLSGMKAVRTTRYHDNATTRRAKKRRFRMQGQSRNYSLLFLRKNCDAKASRSSNRRRAASDLPTFPR